ncbi:hypothetical protein GCM10007913_40240 [Devosia yakushimensis]|uniref:ABC transmembrane type-1 domain-containing protein n=1 Tax=Devosia yakushimensis TaxID=470028 RepID=A0ABQ5UJ69_9HYPH|nr:carbohydrate ABC transporter permease [Devosia yakushimensis]GLQ12092.1 hypothetical protein GCM10007913_40240 [Devosia yakushimensis]
MDTKAVPIRRYIALILASVVFLFPLLLAILASLKTPAEMLQPLSLPSSIYFANYMDAVPLLARPLLNSLLITAPAVVISVLIGALAAFPLATTRLPGDRVIFVLLLMGMFVPFQITQLPVFFTIRSLGLYDNIMGLWLVHAAYAIPFCTFFMRNYFATVPKSLWEAAQMDGCSPASYFVKVLLPASLSGLAALAIVQARYIWNDLLFALTLTNSDNASPVTLKLYGMIGMYESQEGLLMASTLLAAAPIVLAFLLFQNAFTRGLLGGVNK